MRNRDKWIRRGTASRREIIRCYKKAVEITENALCEGELVEDLYDVYRNGRIPFDIYFQMIIGIVRDMREWPWGENND